MAKKLSSVVGIDIGSQKIKIAEVKSRGRQPEITALAIVDTPEGAVDNTGVYNSDAVGAALKQALKESGASVAQAVVSIAGQASVLVRTLEVPRMNPTELKEHMQWEINRNIPFAETNVLSDFKALPDEDPNSANMDVVMAIAPQSAVDTMVACLKKAGRTPVAIDVEPLSLARTLQAAAEDYVDQTVCVVDMGHMTTSINIYRNGKLLMPRQIPIGGEMFTKAIADGLMVTTEEAEALKTEQAEIPAYAIQNASSAPNDFSGFMMPTADAGGGAATQQFQPYNPFGEDPVPAANPFLTDTPATPDPGANPYGDPAADPYAAPADPYATPADPMATPDPYATDPAPAAEPAPEAYEPITPEPDPQPQMAVNPFEAVDTPASSMAPVVGDSPEATRLYNTFASVLEEFVSEIRRSIDYFQSRGGSINRVVLSGGGTKLRGITAYLSASLGMECDAYDPLSRLTINSKRVAPGYVEEHAQEFAVALGNGLHIFYD